MLHVLYPSKDLLIHKAAFLPAFSSDSKPSKHSRNHVCMQNNSSFYMQNGRFPSIALTDSQFLLSSHSSSSFHVNSGKRHDTVLMLICRSQSEVKTPITISINNIQPTEELQSLEYKTQRTEPLFFPLDIPKKKIRKKKKD